MKDEEDEKWEEEYSRELFRGEVVFLIPLIFILLLGVLVFLEWFFDVQFSRDELVLFTTFLVGSAMGWFGVDVWKWWRNRR